MVMAMAVEETDELFRSVLNQVADLDLRKEAEQGEGAAVPAEALDENTSTESAMQSIYSVIQNMSVAEKVKAALLGNKTVRGLLIRDRIRQIPLLVLENPKLTEAEVEEFARNTTLDDSIHRKIAASSHWTRSYPIRWALVSNPKVPVAISLQWLKYLKDNELSKLAKSKNVSGVISQQSRKLLERRRTKGS